MMKTNLLNVARQFNNDEDGIEAMQVVMIVAIAAIVLIAVMTLGQDVKDWAQEKWDTLRGKSIT